ncbi:DUF4336 domain-containing protein [Parvibaculum sp.]|uniref:DUF4336 domain-containing protein n=1 Tax=Parvibaculum sp. TaxID=2024848 RepID=UPI000C35C756|nr:DUF4336 domain-containing protein [Parvibaculum sp.]MAU59518.1 hypothetical protein [Parvibaculum sp.]MBO6667951.1 DUF4336 domain-containing protein [Parvibaculum sp.]MBO6690564.1 DUF4336 domain-containing protein [Parvibaculum sp.]MBO6714813.1 DUF4336 domain-containing protein [Parvibaculum sp.]|tara:strand:+ start:2723 stop:3415 length:693 start_codon:yes stop_codon:yes gene_type:complete
MLTSFAENIWIADGPIVDAALGFHYPTRMAVIRLSGGGLFVWSPVPLTEELRAGVAALGEVRHIVAPNSLHHLFIPEWAAAFPAAKLHAAPGLAKKRKDIAFDSELGDEAPSGWAGEIDQAVMRGNTITEEVVFFHAKSGTVLFTDLVQHLPQGWYRGWRAIVAKLDLMSAPEASVPRKFRLAFTGRRAARAALARVLEWPSEKVLMAHGAPVTQDARAFLARAFGWLSR